MTPALGRFPGGNTYEDRLFDQQCLRHRWHHPLDDESVGRVRRPARRRGRQRPPLPRRTGAPVRPARPSDLADRPAGRGPRLRGRPPAHQAARHDVPLQRGDREPALHRAAGRTHRRLPRPYRGRRGHRHPPGPQRLSRPRRPPPLSARRPGASEPRPVQRTAAHQPERGHRRTRRLRHRLRGRRRPVPRRPVRRRHHHRVRAQRRAGFRRRTLHPGLPGHRRRPADSSPSSSTTGW